MNTLPLSVSKTSRSFAPVSLFGLVYIAALAIIFAPEGSLSTSAGSAIVATTR